MKRAVKKGMLICLLLSPLLRSALASDVKGTWKGEMAQGGEVAFTLNSAGETLTGTWTGREGKQRPIKDGHLNGDSISFAVDSEWQGMPVTLLVKGTVAGNEMRLRIDAANGYWGTDARVRKQ